MEAYTVGCRDLERAGSGFRRSVHYAASQASHRDIPFSYRRAARTLRCGFLGQSVVRLRRVGLIREGLSEQSRAEAAEALRAVAVVAQAMAKSLEETRGDEDEPPTNYGMQK
jgi:hypothetical protein